MTLRLALLNVDRLPDGGPLQVEVAERGLDIGWAPGLGWTLADPGRHISGRHREIRFRDRGYWLDDISSNGTFFNGSRTRVEGPRLLHNGDRITIGPYVIGVEVETAAVEEASLIERGGVEMAGAFAGSEKDVWSDRGRPARRPTRKLAAILAADVAGFSRLASADEDRTLARLRALRSDLIEPAIAAHDGRLVKHTGDGVLAEFRSVVNAVRCAMEVQAAMVERNAGLAPDRRIDFRIGVHLGDVVEEDDGDLMGEGVNIAARLETAAKPGGIYLSQDGFRHVKSRLDCVVEDLGPLELKNIAEPVRVYSVDASAQAAAAHGAEPSPRNALPTVLVPAAPRRGLGLAVAAFAAVVVSGGAGLAIFATGGRTDLSAAHVDEALRLADAAFDNWSFAEALQRYRKLADAAGAAAQTKLGDMYQHGLGVARDYPQALPWYRKAADQGDPAAEAALGTFYRDGRAVERDPAAALQWFRVAADAGYAPAQMMIGSMYAGGQGVGKDCAAARPWFEKAAALGNGAARAWIASNDDCPAAN